MLTDWQHRGTAIMLLAASCIFSACQGADPGSRAASAGANAVSAAPAPDYVREPELFALLLSAGLSGDYAAFATALRADADPELRANLQRSFNGRPFDVYTRATGSDDTTFRRFIELRNSSGRLYLLVKMQKVPGGWAFAGFEIDRQAKTLRASL